MSVPGTVTSILIVNYRAYREVRQCLTSLERFVGEDVEVIVVDHETDPAEARELEGSFPWVRLDPVAANPGFAAGVNRAARLARGRFLLLLNPDCIFQSDVCRTLAAWLDANPGVGIAGPKIFDEDGSIQASARRFPDFTTPFGGRTSWLTRVLPSNSLSRRNLLSGEHVQSAIEVDWVSGACMMIRQEAFRAVGGMDEGFFLYWEDADLCFRLKALGWRTVYQPLVAVTHVCGASSAHAPRRSLVAFHRSAFRYYMKHRSTAGVLLAPVVFLGLQVRLLLKLGLRRR